MKLSLSLLLSVAAFAGASLAHADTATFTPAADCTLIQSSTANQWAEGSGYAIFCGRVGPNGENLLRRAALRFDISSIPAGSQITSVSLKLYMSQGAGGSVTCTLHRFLQSWGEGASFAFGGAGTFPEANDVTWLHRFYPNVLWTTPGGDFDAAVSSSKLISGAGFWSFPTSALLVSDVQGWLDNPAVNHGWMLRGNEVNPGTAKKFDSKELISTPSHWPLLTVTYNPPVPPIVGDLNHDGKVDGADLGQLLAAWGLPGTADLNADSTVDGADLGMLLANWTV